MNNFRELIERTDSKSNSGRRNYGNWPWNFIRCKTMREQAKADVLLTAKRRVKLCPPALDSGQRAVAMIVAIGHRQGRIMSPICL
jgi:hypothetical protein